MRKYHDLTLDELAQIYCMDKEEFHHFLRLRNLHLHPDWINGKLVFPTEEVQAHLQSHYFI